LAATLPDVPYVEIADAGHCTPLETPDLVAKALSQHVAK
jgi:pimeloyl-ACP methyl ester carboxylesterase